MQINHAFEQCVCLDMKEGEGISFPTLLLSKMTCFKKHQGLKPNMQPFRKEGENEINTPTTFRPWNEEVLSQINLCLTVNVYTLNYHGCTLMVERSFLTSVLSLVFFASSLARSNYHTTVDILDCPSFLGICCITSCSSSK